MELIKERPEELVPDIQEAAHHLGRVLRDARSVGVKVDDDMLISLLFMPAESLKKIADDLEKHV